MGWGRKVLGTQGRMAHIVGLWDVTRTTVHYSLCLDFVFALRYNNHQSELSQSRVHSEEDLGTHRGWAGCFGSELSGARCLKPEP